MQTIFIAVVTDPDEETDIKPVEQEGDHLPDDHFNEPDWEQPAPEFRYSGW